MPWSPDSEALSTSMSGTSLVDILALAFPVVAGSFFFSPGHIAQLTACTAQLTRFIAQLTGYIVGRNEGSWDSKPSQP